MHDWLLLKDSWSQVLMTIIVDYLIEVTFRRILQKVVNWFFMIKCFLFLNQLNKWGALIWMTTSLSKEFWWGKHVIAHYVGWLSSCGVVCSLGILCNLTYLWNHDILFYLNFTIGQCLKTRTNCHVPMNVLVIILPVLFFGEIRHLYLALEPFVLAH